MAMAQKRQRQRSIEEILQELIIVQPVLAAPAGIKSSKLQVDLNCETDERFPGAPRDDR
jgi:hypothetical protein